MWNAHMVGAAGLALVMAMMAGTGSAVMAAQAAKKKAVGKAAAKASGPAPTAAEVAAAEEIYKTKCAVCHTVDGNSPIPQMNFADGEWKHGAAIRDVMNTIANGIPGTAMMSFKTQFSEGEISALARKVRTFDKKLK